MSSLLDRGQVQKEGDRDWVHFGLVGLDDTLTIGHYEKVSDPITITYEGVPFSSYLVGFENLGLRAVPLYSKQGMLWIDKLKIEAYEGGKPDTSEYMGRKMNLSEYVVRIKEKKVIKREFLHQGAIVRPSEFELDKNYGYWPKGDQYNDFRSVGKVVTEFPPTLEPHARAEVVIEIIGRDGQPFGLGIYRFRAILDARDFDLKLPESHDRIFTSTKSPVEVREIKTVEDRGNYHYLLSQHLIKEKNLAAAEAELILGTTANPDSTAPWLALGRFYESELKDYDKAISAYERAKAISDRKGLKPSENDAPRLRRVDGKLLYEEPPYWPGSIERVQQKKLEKRGS
jgi:tetratricopeptide (TPR) repeat protein